MPKELIVMFVLQCCMVLANLIIFINAVQQRKTQRAWFLAGALMLLIVAMAITAVKLFPYL